MRTAGLLLAGMFAATLCAATPRHGIVFEDRNGNGVLDKGERGISGVGVSDGDTVVLTGRDGRFVLEAGSRARLFPILPSGYSARGSMVGNRAIFRIPAGDGEEVRMPLVKQQVPDRFRIGAVGDIQVENQQELSLANRTILSELANRSDLAFYLQLGDLVNDNEAMLADMGQAFEQLPATSWCVSGNHDRSVIKPRNLNVYNGQYGGDYAFHYGKVCFVMLNNVHTVGDGREYVGGVDARQLRFLKNVLAHTPADETVVLGVHVPLYSMENRDEVLGLLSSRDRVLVLSAHAHRVNKYVYPGGVCEQVVGSPCGMFWLGERDYHAIPAALQQCGSPRNYFVVDFDKDDYRLSFKGIGLDASSQADIWLKGEEVLDDDVLILSDLPEGTLLANIYGGCDSTRVRMRIDGGPWQSMEYVKRLSPASARVGTWIRSEDHHTKAWRRQPMKSSPSTHLWQGALPDGLSSGYHKIEIEARDDYGFACSQTKVVRLN